MLGLPDGVNVCLFDLDGVLTQTAKVHAAAWKSMFDEFLEGWARDHGQQFVPFDKVEDYNTVRRRQAALRRGPVVSRSRAGSSCRRGRPRTRRAAQTVDGLGNRKNELVLKLIHEQGVEPYEGSVRYVHAVIDAGLKHAVVSSSTNTRDVLHAAGIADLFDTIVDGVVADREHLKGKPAPDTYLAGARALGADPKAAAVFEDALVGRRGGPGRGRSGSSSGSTGWATATRCALTAPTWS